MSFAASQIEHVREALDTLRLPKSADAPIILIENLFAYGHIYNHQTITNSGTAVLGNVGTMCKFLKFFYRRSKDSTGVSQASVVQINGLMTRFQRTVINGCSNQIAVIPYPLHNRTRQARAQEIRT